MAAAVENAAQSAPAGAARIGLSGTNWALWGLLLFAITSLAAWNQAPGRVEGPRGAFEWFLTPIEKNAVARLPAVNAELRGVAVLPDGRAIAVGDGGTILTSADAGASWTEALRWKDNERWLGGGYDEQGFNSVSLLPDGRAIAVGDSGVVLTSADSGAHWTDRSGPFLKGELNSVSLSTYGSAIAVGDGGMILTSADAGLNWTRRTNGRNDSLTSVSLLPDGRAIAVGRSDGVWTSADAGRSWVQRSNATESTLLSVSISPDGRAIAVGDNGSIVTSFNAGASWTQQQARNESIVFSVSLASDGKAIAVGEGGTILTSGDGGKSWTTTNSRTGSIFNSVLLLDDGSAVTVGSGGAILTSADAGSSWEATSKGDQSSLTSLAFLTDQRAIAVGREGIILTSADSGESWDAQRSGTKDWLKSVALSADKHAIAVGWNGSILTSIDNGASWTDRSKGAVNRFTTVVLASNGSAIASAEGKILRSSNAGTDWILQARTHFLNSVSLTSGGTVVGAGAGGAILTSPDFGKNWEARSSGEILFTLSSISSLENGRAIAVGEHGTIVTSLDGGQSWTARNGGSENMLQSVSLAPDNHAITVGDSGTILTSTDAGSNWTARNSGALTNLNAVSLLPNGKAIAVGEKWTVLLSSDFGQTWRKVAHPLPYSRYPAPWYWLAFLLSLLLLWLGLRSTFASPDEGAAAIAASDAPALTARQDRLDFLPLARGISRFLRNTNTQPPLTLAITGDWGSGKSSLMGLVCEDLRSYGWRPIWFNAWHHQKEEQLLPALLDALRVTGLPPAHTPAGLIYRLKLLWLRSRKHYLMTLLAVAISAALAGYLFSHSSQEDWASLTAFAQSFTAGRLDWTALLKSWALPALVLQIAAALSVIATVRNALKAFGMDPAVLLTSSMEKTRLKDMSAQTGFRTQFAREFDEVTQSLPFPPVIVIDDLDRCQPDTVLDIMEAVNFLTSSGRCFVIFGMARERVQASLALSFKDIARELAEFDLPDASSQPDDKAERDKRQRYARDYLEKLVNIEVIVPDRADIPPHRLLEKDEESNAKTLLARAARWVKPFALVTPLLLTVVAAGYWGAEMGVPQQPKPEQAAPAPQVSQAQAEPSKRPAPATETPLLEKRPSGPIYTPGDDRPVSPLWFMLGLTGLAGLGALMTIRRLRKENAVVIDTKEFRDALRIWSPIATYSRHSPRSIKRFGNRIRYLAMLQQGAQLDEQPWLERGVEAVWNWVQEKKGAEPQQRTIATETETNREQALSEHRVVALGALHEHFGDEWKRYAGPDWSQQYSILLYSEPKNVGLKVEHAISRYEEATRATWPPSEDEILAFERSLKGIRVDGDSEPIETRRFQGSGTPIWTADEPEVVGKGLRK